MAGLVASAVASLTEPYHSCYSTGMTASWQSSLATSSEMKDISAPVMKAKKSWLSRRVPSL